MSIERNRPTADDTPASAIRLEYESQGVSVQKIKDFVANLQLFGKDLDFLDERFGPQIEAIRIKLAPEQKEYDRLYRETILLEERIQEIQWSEGYEAEVENLRRDLDRVWTEYATQQETVRDLQRQEQDVHDRVRRYAARDYSHAEAFYVTSSDNLRALRERVDVRGKKAATVAGNGDFWQAFVDGGAREVVVFDMSLPALMYSELKLAALRGLTFDEYRDLIGNDGKEIVDRVERMEPFIRQTAYARIRRALTPQAQNFFDLILNLDGAELYPPTLAEGFIRARNREAFVGDIVRTEEEYAALAERARKVSVRFALGDINASPKIAVGSDVAYLSNIGYRLDVSLGIAGRLLADAQTVILSTGGSRTIDRITPDNRVTNDLGLSVSVLATGYGSGGTILEVTKTSSAR